MEKVKLIRGSKARAAEIRKILEEWGGTNERELSCENEDNYYYLDTFGHIDCIYCGGGDYRIEEGRAEIYELPELKPFDKVLVRDIKSDKWKCNIFSHKDCGYYVCVEAFWKQCIPFEGNEELLGTANNPIFK